MNLAEYLRELAFPLRSSGALIALVTFYLLFGLSAIAGLLGLWLLVATLPAYLRYLTMIAEARAKGIEAAPPGIEYFSLAGNAWTLFPVVPMIAIAWLVFDAGRAFGPVAALVTAVGAAALFPASIAVLVITHSPLQSLNPVAIGRLYRGCGASYWYAPATAVLFVIATPLFDALPAIFGGAVEIYLLMAFFAVIGAVMRENNLIDEVDIPDALEPDIDTVIARTNSDRTKVLNHAYGFVSRGNRDGGLEHIYQGILHDPDPDAAWSWYFGHMTRWEDPHPALVLGQQYLGRLLELGDQPGAMKLILRCRMFDENFRPLAADRQRAIDAAEACGHEDLLAVLRR